MCDVNGPFKLCTCSEKVDTSKPYWVLRSNRCDDKEYHVVGTFSQPNQLFTPILRRNILRRLNTVKSIFDFQYTPKEMDLLKLCGEYEEYYCEFKEGKWRWLENFEYFGKKSDNYRNIKKGYIESTQSKLMAVLEEYYTLTNTPLYRNDDLFFEPKNDFEKKLYYSKKVNQKEIIEIIKAEIKRLKNKN